MTDELVLSFMRAVSDLGKGQKGRASGEHIMQHMGLDPSDLYLGNPSSDKARQDALLYKALAQECKNMGYITKEADRSTRIAITQRGEQYAKGG
jgi:hypothetical protein